MKAAGGARVGDDRQMVSPTLSKASMGYEGSVPRCETCVHWVKPRILAMRDSLPTWSVPTCRIGGFSCKRTAVCDHWENARGERLVEGLRAPGSQAAPVVPAEAAP